MGIVKRQGFWASIYTYLGILLGYLNMVVIFPLILTSEDFGLVRVIIATAIILSKVGEFGLSNTVNRFFTYFRDPEKKHYGFLSFILLFSFVLNAGVALAAIVFKETIYKVAGRSGALGEDNLAFVIIIAISITFGEILSAYARSNKRAVFPAFVKEILLRVFQLLAIAAYWFGLYDFPGLVGAIAVSYLLQTMGLLVYLRVINILVLPLRVSMNQVLYLKEVVIYSFYMFLNKLPSMTLNQIDILMLGFLASKSDSAVYFIAFSLANVIRVPARNINQITNPIIADSWKRNDVAKISKMYYQSSLNQLLIGGVVLVLVLVNIKELVFFLDKGYQQIYSVVLLVGLSKLFDMVTGINGIIINTSKYFRYSLIFNSALLVMAVFANYLFIPMFGIEGAAFATALSIFTLNTIKYLFVWRKFKMQPFRMNTLWAVGLIGLCFAIGELMPVSNIIIVDIMIRSIVVGSIFLAIIYKFKISIEIWETIDDILERVKRAF